MCFLCTRFDHDVWAASALFDVYNSLHQSVAVCWLIANGKRNRNQPFITSYNKTPTGPCRLTFLQINQINKFFVLDLRQTINNILQPYDLQLKINLYKFILYKLKVKRNFVFLHQITILPIAYILSCFLSKYFTHPLFLLLK